MNNPKSKYKMVKWYFGKEIKIPEDWTVRKLEQIGEIVGGGTPDSTNKEYWQGDLLWAVPTDITRLRTNWINDTERKITKKGLDNSSARILPAGAILLTSRATIGECAIATKPISTNQGFQSIICYEEFNELFIFYLLKYSQQTLLRLSYGTTFLEISKAEIKKAKIITPMCTNEQQKIASILSGVDATIEATQGTIEKTERLRQGLIQQLLTRGISHEKFKKVRWRFGEEIEIPKKWDVTTLSNVCKVRNDSPGKSDLYIGLEHIEQHSNRLIQRGNIEEFTSNKNTFCKNDILYGKLRPILNKVLLMTEDGYCSTDIVPLQPNLNKIDPQILLLILSSYRFFWYAVSTSAGTKMPRTRWTDMKQFLVFCPALSEQVEIASILSGVDAVYSLLLYTKTHAILTIFLRLWRVTTS